MNDLRLDTVVVGTAHLTHRPRPDPLQQLLLVIVLTLQLQLL